MVKIPSVRDASIRTALKQAVQPDGTINLAGIKAVAIAAGDGGAISKTERKDLENLLAKASLEPGARKLLADFLASPQANAPAPSGPLAQRTNPAFAFFGTLQGGGGTPVDPGTTTPGTTPGTPPGGNAWTGGAGGTTGPGTVTPPVDPPVERPKTVPPAAAIASTAQSNQTTGPDARPLNFAANALVQMWAVPGSTVRVYNNSVLVDGKPKLLKEITAPMTSNATGPRCMSGAYPTMDAFNKEAQKFNAAPHAGLVLVSVPLAPGDDQDARDILSVTQQVGTRTESDRRAVRMFSYSAFPRVDRAPVVDTSRVTLNGNVLSTSGDFAVTPGTFVQAVKDGVRTNVYATADENGQLSLDLSSVGTSSNVVLMTATTKGTAVPVDFTALGLGSTMPGVNQRLAALDNAIARGFAQEPQGGKLRFEVPGVLDGVALEVRNPANPSQVQTFVASGGKLVVDVQDAWAGDSLAIRMDLSRVGDTFKDQCFRNDYPHQLVMEGPDGRGRLQCDGTVVLPNAAQAQRTQDVLAAFPNARRPELLLALELFGPHSRVAGGQAITDPARMRETVRGAMVGSSTPRAWASSVQRHLQTHGTPGMQQGFALGQEWLNRAGQSLVQSAGDAGYRAVTDPNTRRATSYTLAVPGLPELNHLPAEQGYLGPVQLPSMLYWNASGPMANPRGASFSFTLPP